ncbi:hypothetical protein L6164_006296 [Bauhinia variegata]|uniref:Uncharacterized protein n=1 Tax=Bauhinia variegata TaxID=167791 RepID=A0ACB9PTH7_BAUVA|nr:hypothetical protein L6164_006296 [Bauhinia variegata]
MHCALRQTSTDSLKVSKAQKDSLSRKYQEPSICAASLKDCKESSLSRWNSDSGCSILAFLTLQPDGNWRIVALPVQCLNHISLAPLLNMDGLQLVFPPALNRLKIDQHKGQRGLLSEYGYSVKSLNGRSINGSTVYRRCQKKIASRASKLNELSGNSCSQSSLICSNSSGLFPDSSEVNPSDMAMSNSKGDKPLKKNSRKKARKRGRQTKKQSCDSGSTEPEVLPEEYVHVGSTSESHCSNDVDNEVGLMSDTAGLETSFSDDRLIRSDFERGEMDDTVNRTEALKTCYSYIEEAEMSEVTLLTVQKSSGESAICNSKNQIQNRGPELIDIDGEMEDKQQIQICCHDNMYSKESSQIQDTLVLGSVSVGANSDESTHTGDIVKQSDKASCRIGLSIPPGFNSGSGCLLGHSLLNGVDNTCDQNEGMSHGTQNCSNNDKKIRQKRKAPRISGVNKFGGVGNLHGRTGKENSHSVWQKVQKNDHDDCSADLKKANSTFSQSDSTMKRAPPVNRSCNFNGANILSKSEEKKHLKNNDRKSKGKMDQASKKEHCSYSRKGSHFNKAILSDDAKINVQQNGMLHILSQENNQEGLTSASGSHLHVNSPRVGFQSSQVEQMASESVHSAQMHLEESKPPKSVGHTISTMTNQDKESQDSSLPMPCDHINQLCTSEEQSPLYSHLLGDEAGQIEKEVSSADYNEPNNSAGSTLWKWIPVGKKDKGLAFSESASSSLEYSHGPPSKDIILESNVAPEEVSISQNHFSSSNASTTCADQTYRNFPCLSEDENLKLGNQVANALTEHNDKHLAANHLICECENRDVIDSFSYKISQAINDVCRVQIACEAVQIATGGPIAEFERLLHCCSPVICQSSNVLPADGIPLCRHETPDLSLGCLWQWYEKHGSYGLEIRAQDYKNPKELGACFPFRAYFVPSLSAVQLFKNHKSQCVINSHKSPHCKGSEVYEASNKSESLSAASPDPILSPESRIQDASIPMPTNEMYCSEAPSVCTEDNASGGSIKSTCSGDLELLFEYFESEQPQQRRPLFEKIQELVRGDASAQSKMYGDPSKLDSVNLQDVHPSSWYSVAWYPIYRIPDGNFRASFLTYHSFGHFVNRSMKTDTPTVDSGIVAPVVGLQSYNAQGECWFQLRHCALTAELMGLNPSILLKERLRTLEVTASLMARAVVNMGNLIGTNRHPDYEFFLSRRRY